MKSRFESDLSELDFEHDMEVNKVLRDVSYERFGPNSEVDEEAPEHYGICGDDG